MTSSRSLIRWLMVKMKKKRQSTSKDWKDSLSPLAADINASAKKLEDNLFLSIVQVAIAVPRFWDFKGISKPVSRPGFRVLRNLITHKGRMTPTEISKEILLSKYAVTRIVDSLEKNGLVKREPFGDDLRTRDVIITNKGLKLANGCADYLSEHVMKQFSPSLTSKQIQDIRVFLKKFRSHLVATIPDSSPHEIK
jgi:DNA-binding MarR family transcriptional regulator